MNELNIAVVGTTRQIGRVMRTLLTEHDFPVETVRFFSSSRSSGTILEWRGQHVTVKDITTSDFSEIDIAVFSAGASASHGYAPKLVAQDAVVVDNSSAQRRDPEVPLVVSEVNPEDAMKRPKGTVANPNCTTMAAMPVLRPLVNEADGLERLFISSYQAVSGSGVKGVQELASQTRSGVSQDLVALALDGCATTLSEPEVYAAPIALDIVPLTGSIIKDGSEETDEKQKLRNESRRILHIPNLHVSGTRMRVPAFTRRTLTIHAELSGAITTDEVREVLASAPGVRLVEAPTPLKAAGHDEMLCGRIRQDQAVEGSRGLVPVLSDDNPHKGAALSTIQVTEVVAKELLG